MKKKIFASLVFAVICSVVCANPWSYHGPKRDIVNLIVTVNYEKPRLIADLIQIESRQPYLLLPVNDDGNIYFCPYKRNNPKFVSKKNLAQILAIISPKQIIVLGNERYVSQEYVKEFRKIAPVVVINAENWQLAADTVAPMLNLSRLPESFRKLNAELESGRLFIPKKKEEKADDELSLTDDPAKKDSSVKKEAPAKTAPETKAPAKKSPEEYPAFDAEPEVKKDVKPADVAPLA
ncbi:MAG: hypothetical protein IKA22_02945 [Lentisphaeria bacterium]|nr:hypothetical protein [Lentisphaeria bacterium]